MDLKHRLLFLIITLLTLENFVSMTPLQKRTKRQDNGGKNTNPVFSTVYSSNIKSCHDDFSCVSRKQHDLVSNNGCYSHTSEIRKPQNRDTCLGTTGYSISMGWQLDQTWLLQVQSQELRLFSLHLWLRVFGLLFLPSGMEKL